MSCDFRCLNRTRFFFALLKFLPPLRDQRFYVGGMDALIYVRIVSSPILSGDVALRSKQVTDYLVRRSLLNADWPEGFSVFSGGCGFIDLRPTRWHRRVVSGWGHPNRVGSVCSIISEFPCIFPAGREIAFRDEFAPDCLLQRRVHLMNAHRAFGQKGWYQSPRGIEREAPRSGYRSPPAL